MSEEPSQSKTLVALPENFLDPIIADIEMVIPKNTITAAALTRIAVTAINKDSKLRLCSRGSILASILDVASVGLMPNTPEGLAYLIPYRNNGVMECTLQIGYKGYCELSYRSGQVKIIQGDVTREGDLFEYEKGTDPHLRYRQDSTPGRSKRAVISAWALVALLNGGCNIDVMDAEELNKIQKQAERFKASPAWQQWPDEMRRKSVLKRLLKVLKIGNTPELRKALEIEARAFEVEPDIAPIQPQITFADAPAEQVAAPPEITTTDPPELVGAECGPETEERVDSQGNFVW